MRNRYLSLFYSCCIGVLLFTSACRNSTEDDQVVGKDQDEFTTEEQVRIGESLSNALVTQSGVEMLSTTLYPDLYKYLNTVYATLVQTPGVANRETLNWKVIILKDDNQRNAFTAPDGKLYIYTGLLKYLKSEHELTGLLAHEIYYLDKGMVLEVLKKEYGGTQLADILLGNEVSKLTEMANYLSNIHYAKKDVSNADTFAVETLCPFLYDARGLQSILERAVLDINTMHIAWIERRPGELKDRIKNVARMARDCGANGAKHEDRYTLYKKRLP